MRAVVLKKTGPPGALAWTDVPEPKPGPGEVRVRIRAIGIHYAEVLSRKGLYGWAPRRPYIPGMEAAGVVDRVGEGVERSPGERVLVGTQFGAYAEAVVVPSAQALPWVQGLSDVEAAALPVNYMTAWVALAVLGRPRPGETVSVSPAAGGVGTAAVQIARGMEARVVAMAGSGAKLDRVRALGVDATVCYRDEAFREELDRAVADGGIDVAIEMVGGDVFRAVRDTMAPFGRLVVAGYASLDYRWWNPLSWWRAWRGAPRLALSDQLRRSLGFYATHLGYLLDDPERLTDIWRDLRRFVDRHGIRPQVGHVLPAEEIAEAHRLMESRESYGKIVLALAPGAEERQEP